MIAARPGEQRSRLLPDLRLSATNQGPENHSGCCLGNDRATAPRVPVGRHASFQRLRGIFQTGFTYLVYPCRPHSLRTLARLPASGWACASQSRRSRRLLSPSECLPVSPLCFTTSLIAFSLRIETVPPDDKRIEEARSTAATSPRQIGESDMLRAEVVTYHVITGPIQRSSIRYGAVKTNCRRR
jgi:hypothetical protein